MNWEDFVKQWLGDSFISVNEYRKLDPYERFCYDIDVAAAQFKAELAQGNYTGTSYKRDN